MPGFRRTRPEENRLVEVQVNSVTVAEYVYDGDGNQVKATVTGGDLTITTFFVGSYYEQITTMDTSVTPAVTTTAWKKYYYAGAVRLAMREDSDDPLYLIGDHLGSTSLVIDSIGQQVAKQTYLPFGETWGVSATDLPTDYTFTGQREAAEIGLHYYVARWYDSEIGHFIQADTIVPGAGNPLAWNRYAYVAYSPIKLTDPSGHRPVCGLPGGECPQTPEGRYGITFIQGENDNFWTKERRVAVILAAEIVGKALDQFLGIGSANAFLLIFGRLTFSHEEVSAGYGWAKEDRLIAFDNMYNDLTKNTRLVVHELGHIFDRKVCAANNGGSCGYIYGEGTARKDLESRLGIGNGLNDLGRLDYGLQRELGTFFGFAGGKYDWQFGAVNTITDGMTIMNTGEIWADMFVGWAFNSWETGSGGQLTSQGMARSLYMKSSMRNYISLIIGNN